MTVVWVMIGGFFGALARYSVSQFVHSRMSATFPIATLFVNLLGAFLLGLIIGHGMGKFWGLLLGTGFMGAFTTFSTFKLEIIQLHAKRNWKGLAGYLAISYIGGILIAFAGIMLGMHL